MAASTSKTPPCPKPALEERPLIRKDQAVELMHLFKVLANDTRLRLLHALVRSEELRVTDLANVVGMKPQAVSNQLQLLAARGIVGSRRNGSEILYRLVDPCVPLLLDLGICLSEDADQRRR